MTEATRARPFSRWAPLLLAGTLVVAGGQIARAGFNESGMNSFFQPGPGSMTGPGAGEQQPAAVDPYAQQYPEALPAHRARVQRSAVAHRQTRPHTMQANESTVLKHRTMHAAHSTMEPNRS